MRVHDQYELVFGSGAGPGADAPEDVVEVRRTERTGPGGHPVYADESGIVLAEISDRGEVRMLASGGHQDPAPTVRARPL
ncbi:DUF6296 family protein [Streptomyces sp. LP05-1]|uniref:DUF6296 family protein n=1 Tax=Streptomyces pyxinae TaxID=2970734 RepID=A0ABT2CR05_9ACTN|nr:DUF6296 family protein [Streptomyces sp. LP05-1]MCS0639853.1 DUF6296 family protein [Streptomyces sp. LP05-1]